MNLGFFQTLGSHRRVEEACYAQNTGVGVLTAGGDDELEVDADRDEILLSCRASYSPPLEQLRLGVATRLCSMPIFRHSFCCVREHPGNEKLTLCTAVINEEPSAISWRCH